MKFRLILTNIHSVIISLFLFIFSGHFVCPIYNAFTSVDSDYSSATSTAIRRSFVPGMYSFFDCNMKWLISVLENSPRKSYVMLQTDLLGFYFWLTDMRIVWRVEQSDRDFKCTSRVMQVSANLLSLPASNILVSSLLNLYKLCCSKRASRR